MANKRGSGGGIQNLRDYIQRTDREPLVGLEWVLEYKVHGKRSEVFTKYFCDICDLHCDLVPMIEHLSSVKHRKLYLGRTFPQLLTLPPATKEERSLLLRQLAMEVEKTEGLRMFKTDPNPRKTAMSNGQLTVIDRPQQSRRLETASQRASRWARALEYLQNFEIDSDMEASTVTGLTQKLTAELTTFSNKLKADSSLGPLEPSNRGQPTAPRLGPALPNPGLQNPTSRWQQAAPTLGQKVMPTLGQQVPSMLGKQVTPMLGQQVPSMLGQQMAPTLGRQVPPMLSQQVPPMLGQQVTPMLGQQVPPMLGQQVPSMLGQQMTPALAQQVPSMMGQQMTPTLGQQAQSILGQLPPFGQQTSSILGAPPPFLFKGQSPNVMGLPGAPFVPPIPNSNQSNFGPNLGFPNWPPPFPPNAQPVPPTALQASVPDSDAEDAKFFKKLMSLLSAIPEKTETKTPAASEPPAAKPQPDQKPPEDKAPKEQPRDIPVAEDPGKQKPLASQKPAVISEPGPKPVVSEAKKAQPKVSEAKKAQPKVSEAKKAQPIEDSLDDQNKLLELLLQTRQKSAKKQQPSLGKRNIPDPGFGPIDRDPVPRKEALPPRMREDFPPGPLRNERDLPPRGNDRDIPAPYTRINLSPNRPGKGRFPEMDPAVGRRRPDLEPDLERGRPDPDLDMLLNLVDLARIKRETDRGRRSPEFGPHVDRKHRDHIPDLERMNRESDRGRKSRDHDRERRKRSPERRRSPGPHHSRGSPERPPWRGEERGGPQEKRPRNEEEDFFAPTEEERRERRREDPNPSLTVDLLKRIRGKDMFTVSAILSEYAEEEQLM